LIRLDVEVTDSTKYGRIILRSVKAVEPYRLVASKADCFVDLTITDSAVIEIAFGSCNKG